MPDMILKVKANVRNFTRRIHNFQVSSHVSQPHYRDLTRGNIARTPKDSVNSPDWTFNPNDGLNGYFKKHDGFRDQELHNRKARGFVMRQGTDVKYYTTTFDPSGDPLFHEDNNRVIDRVFDLPLILTFQPENEIYNKFGIQHLDETEVYVHMGLFLELNYQSLRKHCIKPECSEDEHNPVITPGKPHNPIYSQRGYEAFRYYGYTFSQIGPKAGDKIKIEAFNILYEVESVKDSLPQYQHRWRKYWWKLYLKDAMDSGQTVSQDVLDDPEQKKFINDLMGVQSGDILGPDGQPIKYPFDVSDTIDDLKKDIIFRPPEVSPDAPDISKDPNFTPGNSEFGSW